MNLTKDERIFIRRALGLDRDMVAKRSHCTARAGREIAIGDGLVAKGLAIRSPQSKTVETVGFSITEAGFNAVRLRGESIAENELSLMRWRKCIA